VITRGRWFAAVVLAGATLGSLAFLDYWARCHGTPLSREEALRRAEARVSRYAKSFHIPGSLPPMTSMDFDASTNAWLVTFKNDTCQIIVISDRCHGDDIGGAKCD
jgi:hypothetical protein